MEHSYNIAFKILGLEQTTNEDLINATYERLLEIGGTEKELWEWKVAHQDCLTFVFLKRDEVTPEVQIKSSDIKYSDIINPDGENLN